MFHLDPKQAVLDHVAQKPRSKLAASGLNELAAMVADKPVEPGYSATVVAGAAQAIECLLLALTGVVLLTVLGSGNGLLGVVVTLSVVAVAEFIIRSVLLRRVADYRLGLEQYLKVAAGWTGAFVVVGAAVLLLDSGNSVSRNWIIAFWLTGLVVLIAYRAVLRALITRWTAEGRLRRRTVIVGGGKDAEVLIQSIQVGARDDIELLGLFDDRNDDRSPESVASLPKLGRVAELIEFARRTRVDLVIVSMPLFAEHRVLDMLKQLWVLPVDIRLSAHMSKLKFTRKAYSYVGGVPVFDMADRPISDWNLVLKWIFDKLVAITALVLLSPVMIATAIAIKLESPGPVFFRQQRHGFNNQHINMWKFRSMRTDMLDFDASKLVTKDDPRVTRVGRFIRKTSIDELPQLFNVLMDELSIVGPRPHALAAKAADQLYYEAVDGYFARHRVKPGMTGWAQIHGWRGETDTVDKIMNRVNYDLYYIENWSLWLDLKIVALTPLSLFTQSKNAY
ncbi:undecaprenyl-phosphate glucose phosphotransferase [Devosia sp. ZB163]|uniref:undecaprenyl-phosphate glucose phosphotransferase n=1 Tax=Devosia sp. ZB163 TaxID=3025938 RepID=UPI002362CC53|nr:undecaprenyl-phosphate glucose phosphotransferase [Devosia sp. ZB163]MDC9824312.1 undecaprenyl-phosphate glucose phosphotransferase [Devosia sp. ZB163]